MASTVLDNAWAPHKAAGCTGFSTLRSSVLIYMGSFFWFAALVTADAVFVGRDTFRRTAVVSSNPPAVLLGSLIGLNCLAFLFQTWDVLHFQFRMWPVTAINWLGQLGALALTGGLVGYAAGEYDTDELWLAILRAAAQALFTASQFAVTLEYLWRSTYELRDKVATRPVLHARGGLTSLAVRR